MQPAMQLNLRYITTAAIFMIVYVVLDYVSFVRPFHGLGITPWNPSPGISLALIYLGGAAYAPFAILAPALADFIVRNGDANFALAGASSATTGGVYLLAGLALRRVASFNSRLETLRDVLVFIVVAIAAAIAAAAMFGLFLALWNTIAWSDLREVTWRSFVGNLIGTLVTAPIAMMLVNGPPPVVLRSIHLLQLAAILAALLVVFGYREATAFQLFYLLFLPLLWVALSHGVSGAVTALGIIQIGLILGAEIRFGADPGLTALQVLMISLAITGLIVGAITSERTLVASRLREQQAALSRAFRLRSAGEVAATIAHEINQPLTAVTAYSGIATDAVARGDWKLASETITKVKSECDRANRVLRSIREVLSQGGLSKSTVDIAAMLSDLSAIVADDLARKGIRLTIDVETTVPLLSVDEIQLQQAIQNLIVNSSEAILGASVGGLITIGVSRVNAGTVKIEVTDDGPGFAPSVDMSDPTPFVTTKPEGSGLGLIVARAIAESHGGSLSIKTVDHGAQVAISLPISRINDDIDGLSH